MPIDDPTNETICGCFKFDNIPILQNEKERERKEKKKKEKIQEKKEKKDVSEKNMLL